MLHLNEEPIEKQSKLFPKMNSFMTAALKAALAGAQAGEVPVGAVLVHQGSILSTAHNLTRTNKDPTAHAEMLVIREGAALLDAERLRECDLFVTLEPCPMCATAISFARIRRLYFGAYDPKGGGVEHGPRIYSHATCHHKPEVYGGLHEQECGQVLKDFFKDKR